MKLAHLIKFDRAVKFYRDVIGLPLKFASPGWSEFATGRTTLALHPASEKNPACSVELGFTVADLHQFHQEMSAKACSSLSLRPNRISARCWRSSSIPKVGVAASQGSRQITK